MQQEAIQSYLESNPTLEIEEKLQLFNDILAPHINLLIGQQPNKETLKIYDDLIEIMDNL